MEFEKVRLFCGECLEYTSHFISGSGNKSVCDLCNFDRDEVLTGLELQQIENKIYEKEVLKWKK